MTESLGKAYILRPIIDDTVSLGLLIIKTNVLIFCKKLVMCSDALLSLLVNSGNFSGIALCTCCMFITYHVCAHHGDTGYILKRISHLNHSVEIT